MFTLYGEVTLTSERCPAKASAENGIASVRTNTPLDERYDRRTSTSVGTAGIGGMMRPNKPQELTLATLAQLSGRSVGWRTGDVGVNRLPSDGNPYA